MKKFSKIFGLIALLLVMTVSMSSCATTTLGLLLFAGSQLVDEDFEDVIEDIFGGDINHGNGDSESDDFNDNFDNGCVETQPDDDYRDEYTDMGYQFTLLDDGTYSFSLSSDYGLTSASIPDTYRNAPVTKIEDYAFYNCSSLIYVSLPKTLEYIGDYAFYDCTNLIEITIPDTVRYIGNYAFNNCYSIDTTLNLPTSLEYLGEFAFYHCSELDRLYMDNCYSIDKIPDYAFAGCGFERVYLTSTLDTIGVGAFCENMSLTEIEVPASVTQIESEAFARCPYLQYVTFPNSLNSIGDYAFSDCDAIEAIEIPEPVKSIGYYAFGSCDNLTSIYIFGDVDYIEWESFYEVYPTNLSCYADILGVFRKDNLEYLEIIGGEEISDTLQDARNLKSVTINEGVTRIADFAFGGCHLLEYVGLPETMEFIGAYAFQSCESLGYIYLPSSITHIGAGAFSNCTSIESINLPESLTCIEESTFYGCSALGEIVIPNNVTYIGSSAFEGCTMLYEVTLSNSVEYIYSYAFGGCENLGLVYYYGTQDDWDNLLSIDYGNDYLVGAWREYLS